MGTRIYCDNCGNTLRTPNVFCFGPFPEIYVQQAGTVYMGAHGAIGAIGVVPASAPPKANVPPLEHIDLCDRCTSIWMERVRNLTKASEPDA